MQIKDDRVIFSTGRTMYANNGIIGISPELTIFEGHDGEFDVDPDFNEKPLTPNERVELADYMIEQWQQYKAKAHETDLS